MAIHPGDWSPLIHWDIAGMPFRPFKGSSFLEPLSKPNIVTLTLGPADCHLVVPTLNLKRGTLGLY